MLDKAKLAAKALKLQKELKRLKIETEAGDGAVRVEAGLSISQANMSVEIERIHISDEALQDPDQLGRWIAMAANKANKEIMQEATSRMQEVAGGLGLPGM